ncbi:unnamed protein product [Amoebophrya sp. A25]|nr:unnamed protein product [Amoebophrya sp. A25]|eukprot:GSA25T00026019001.1
MPKHDVGSSKWLGNQMKSKGLQKLRFYCQMCQKQCRDENGFKCHQTSEVHLRNMSLFMDNPTDFIDQFSAEFEKDFMVLMSTRYCKVSNIKANTVYMDFIRDRDHQHMNSTIWATLGNFVEYLVRTGQVLGERDNQGKWLITYIDKERDERDAAKAKQEKRKLTEAEKEERHLAKLVAMKPTEDADAESERFTKRDPAAGKVTIALGGAGSSSLGKSNQATSSSSTTGLSGSGSFGVTSTNHSTNKRPGTSLGNNVGGAFLGLVPEGAGEAIGGGSSSSTGPPTKKAFFLPGAMSRRGQYFEDDEDDEDLISEEGPAGGLEEDAERNQEKRPVCWVTPGIVVKVLDKNLKGGKYFKKKGTVLQVHDQEAAAASSTLSPEVIGAILVDIKMQSSEEGVGGKKIRIPVRLLETVIPKVGREVAIVAVSSPHFAARGVLEAIDAKNFCCSVKIKTVVVSSGNKTPETEAVERTLSLDYEDLCKVDTDYVVEGTG